jgi:hypothetical protein
MSSIESLYLSLIILLDELLIIFVDLEGVYFKFKLIFKSTDYV